MRTINTKTKASKTRKKAVESIIRAFVKAGDERNITVLEQVLQENFRALARLPGASVLKPVIESREHYLTLIKEGTIGGKPRVFEVLSVEVWKNTAIVRVELQSDELKFSSSYSLFYAPESGWRIVHDLVELEARGK